MSGLNCNFNGLSSLEKNLAPLSASESSRIEKQMKEWLENSDFSGFSRVLQPALKEAPDLRAIVAAVSKHRNGSTGKAIEVLVVLGTGGSSLGTETIVRALCSPATRPMIYVYDNNDPSFFVEAFSQWNPETTLFYIVSKSGATPETLSQFLAVRTWLMAHLPTGSDWRHHFVFCTDPIKGDLRALAKAEDFTALDIASSVGGRFSVLTAVGLFPAAFAGLDPEEFLHGARVLAIQCISQPLDNNPAFRLARALVSDPKKNISVLMAYSSHLSAFSRWFCQLWAESLGKNGKGFTPYPAVGTTDQHSQVQLYMEGPRDKIIGFVNVVNGRAKLPLETWDACRDLPSFAELNGRTMHELFNAEFQATRDAISQAGIANYTLELNALNEANLGALFYWWELVTAYAGALLQINPFDQPGVEIGKKITKEYLGRSAVK